jgi:thiol-disulfide isomerase/thioredoxin
MSRVRVIFAGLIVALGSCQRQSTTPTSQPSSPSPVQVRLASWDETQTLIAAHKGKVVVLDVWSTWCGPCLKEFPSFAQLHRQHAGQVACISLNCNYDGTAEPPETDRKQIEAFLIQHGATFENVICTDSAQKVFQAIDAASIPIVRVYDREGKLRKQFVNDYEEFGKEGFTYQKHIAPLVEQLLSE